MQLLGNLKEGLVFIVSGPAGSGKSTLVDKLVTEFDSVIRSISYTTRKIRGNEIDGKDYFFISKNQFEEKIKKGDFLEHAKVFDDYYGTSLEFVNLMKKKRKHVVLVIDTQGAMNVMKSHDVISIFLSPPSFETLENRLKNRNTDTIENIKKRLSWAKEEMKMAKNYDYQIINEELEIAYQVLRSIFIAEEHRTRSK